MIKNFVSGFSSYFQALQLIARLGLWSYMFIPCLISLGLGIGILGFAYGISDDISGWLINFYPYEWGKEVLERVVQVFGGLLIGVLGLIVYKNLVIAFAAPFMSPLSERIESELKGIPVKTQASVGQFTRSLVRGITIAIRNIILELFFTLLLFLIGLIPIFTPFTTALIFLVQSYYAGFGNMDYTLERYFNVRGSIQYVRKNRWVALGNGAVFILLLLTGIGFLFAPPLGAAAGTIVVSKRLDQQLA